MNKNLQILKYSLISSIQLLHLVILFLLLISCGSSGGAKENVTISGRITFDRVAVTEVGLDYNNIMIVPVQRSLVAVVEGSNNKIIKTTYTDNNGDYSFTISSKSSVKIQVFSETQNPKITVQDNFTVDPDDSSKQARFVLESNAFEAVENSSIVKDLHAKSGYSSDTDSLFEPRAAAPFAILDSCLKAADFFSSERTVNYPALTINWSEKQSGGSFWDGIELFILGSADDDTDEYDEHVVIHEWGHYFEDKLGRTDSIGGSHSDGDVLDPRVAFSEGWGNALSAMVLFPDSVYKDTAGPNQQSTSILFDVDNNNYELLIDPSYQIGWFSENSVQSIIYDLFDPISNDTEEDFDSVESDAGIIFDIITKDIKDSESLGTIFTYVNGFNQRVSGMDIDSLLALHSINPILDAFGSNQTNDGGFKGGIPVYNKLKFGENIEIKFDTLSAINQLGSIRYVKISNVSGKGSIAVIGGGSKDVLLSHKGIILKRQTSSSTININNFIFESSKTYILIVNASGSSANVTLTEN